MAGTASGLCLIWGEQRRASKWQKIVSIRPTNIGCSVEQAVQDILRHWQRAKKRQPWCPNCPI